MLISAAQVVSPLQTSPVVLFLSSHISVASRLQGEFLTQHLMKRYNVLRRRFCKGNCFLQIEVLPGQRVNGLVEVTPFWFSCVDSL